MRCIASPSLAPSFAVFLTCFAVGQTAQAQEAPEIIVTGRALAAPASDRTYDVTVIDAAALSSTASARIEDLLRDEGGMQQFRRSDSRSAHPTSQGAGLRGLGGNASSRALVLLDGVPLADPFGGWIDWPSLDPRRLGQVRVTRGGGAGAFGAGALAGVIELDSAARDELPAFDAGIAYGERNSVIADAAGTADLLGGFGTLSGRVDSGDGFTPIRQDQRGIVDRPAPYDQWNVRGRYVAPLGDDIELQTSISAYSDDRDRGTNFTDNKSEGQDVSLRVIGRGEWGWEALAFGQRREFQSQFAAVPLANRSTVSQSLDQFKTPANGYGAKFELRPPVGENSELRIGVDYRESDGDTNERFTFVAGAATRQRKAGGENDTLGAFVEYTIEPVEKLTLTASGRIDHWQIMDGNLREWTIATGATLRNDIGADRDDTETLGRVGASYVLTSALTVRAAAYQSYRLPTLNELYRPFRVGNDYTAANRSLKPEKLKGAEIGLEGRIGENLKAGASVFWNGLDDTIANVTNLNVGNLVCGAGVTTCRQRQNLDGIEAVGVELDASYRLGDWRVLGAYNYSKSEVSGAGAAAALDGLRPAQSPRHQASVTVEWNKQDGPRAALTTRYVSSQFEDDQNTRSLASAVTLDGFIAVPLNKGLSVELRGENMTDESVEAAISATGVIEEATPRTMWVALRYTM